MPIKLGKDGNGCFARWGAGKKYYYTCGNAEARKRAQAKASQQGKAAYAKGYK